MRFCTVATPRTLPHARVLADALHHHHPGSVLHVVALGAIAADDSAEPFDVVRAEAVVDDPPGGGLLRTHAMDDLARLLGPLALAHIFDGTEATCFLTPEHDVLAPLDTTLAGRHVALVPRADGELPDDTHAPDAEDLRDAGPFSGDFIVVGPGPRGHAFVEWYRDRTAAVWPRLAYTEPAKAREAARIHLARGLSLAPALLDEEPVSDPGVEASYWNLHARPLTRAGDVVLARDRPLRSLHLAGFDPGRPYWLSDAGTRVRVMDAPVLGELCAGYASRLLDRGWNRDGPHARVGQRLATGMVIDQRLLTLYDEAAAEGALTADVLQPEGAAQLSAWMRGPAPVGAACGVNRYLYRVYLERPDIPKAYPDLDGADGPGFAGWAWAFGRHEMSIPDEFLPPHPGHEPPPAARAPAPGVNVAGFFRGTLGLGEAARLYVEGLRAAGIPVTTTTVEHDRPVRNAERRLGKDYGKLAFADLAAAEEAAFNLICVNADELPRFIEDSGPGFFAGRRSIGVWAWETDVVPERWDAAYEHLDEIWVYSRYVAENLGRAAPIPVVCVPPTVRAPELSGEPSGIELPPGLRFMFMFDFFSTQKRKNAVGVIDAFRRAFRPGEGPQLLIKTINGGARPQAYDELRHAAGDREDIHVVDRALSVEAKNALMAECDCYVSLHRSEGYGLTLAECMALGKPVIGTAYSGNLDFMSPLNSYLVDHTMTTVGSDVEIYPPDGRWAEPDLDHAARCMRDVVERPEEARARGERARRDIAEHLSPEVAGRIARARLERLVRFTAARA